MTRKSTTLILLLCVVVPSILADDIKLNIAYPEENVIKKHSEEIRSKDGVIALEDAQEALNELVGDILELNEV